MRKRIRNRVLMRAYERKYYRRHIEVLRIRRKLGISAEASRELLKKMGDPDFTIRMLTIFNIARMIKKKAKRDAKYSSNKNKVNQNSRRINLNSSAVRDGYAEPVQGTGS